jgi:hypothetical protein
LPLTYDNKEHNKVQDKMTQVSQVLQLAHLMEAKEDKVLAANRTIDNRSARRKRS